MAPKWKINLYLRKGTPLSAAIQKQLKHVFGKEYIPPSSSKTMSGRYEHLLNVSVNVDWDSSRPWSETAKPVFDAIDSAFTSIGAQISNRGSELAIPGDRCELTLEDDDHAIAFYTRPTDAGKKKARTEKRKMAKLTTGNLMDITGDDDFNIFTSPDF